MPASVVTVTLNPAIDLTVEVAHLTPGAVQRASAASANVGGKGVNVAGCLADWGASVAATGVIGRGNARAFADFFALKGIEDHCLQAPGDTRTNIKIADTVTGDTTDINLPGLTVGTDLLAEVAAILDTLAGEGTVAVLAGSLPTGLKDDAYVALTGPLRARGVRVVLDTSGQPLNRALAASPASLPNAVKPNRHELEAWAGRQLPTIADLTGAARDLIARGIDLVVVSMGADGALFVKDGEALSARLPPLRALSTVGAGDAMVAGIVSGLVDNLDLEALARRAVAFAAAKLERVGPHLPSVERVEARAREARLARLAS